MLMGKSSPAFTLDLTDPTYGSLSGYADRIGKLLTAPTLLANPEIAGSLDDFLGAVYALIQAKHHGFKDRPDRGIDIGAVQKRAAKIATGHVRTDGKWIAGFYFNNALFRTAAVYHRVLRIVVGQVDTAHALLPKAQKLYPHWTNGKLVLVHRQVNGLKHEPGGVYLERAVGYLDTVAAVGELLDLIEASTAASVLSKTKPLT
jgi:hypothetical protein